MREYQSGSVRKHFTTRYIRYSFMPKSKVCAWTPRTKLCFVNSSTLKCVYVITHFLYCKVCWSLNMAFPFGHFVKMFPFIKIPPCGPLTPKCAWKLLNFKEIKHIIHGGIHFRGPNMSNKSILKLTSNVLRALWLQNVATLYNVILTMLFL